MTDTLINLDEGDGEDEWTGVMRVQWGRRTMGFNHFLDKRFLNPPLAACTGCGEVGG